MAYIRLKQIPPGSGNHYRYLVKGNRENSQVKQKVIKYLGRAGGPHDRTIHEDDDLDDVPDEILEKLGTTDIINKYNIPERPQTKDFLDRDYRIEWGYPPQFVRSDPYIIRVPEDRKGEKMERTFVHEVGHGAYYSMDTNDMAKWSEVYDQTAEWYDNLEDREKRFRYGLAKPVDRATKTNDEMEKFAESFAYIYGVQKSKGRSRDFDNVPPKYKDFMISKFGKPRDMEYPDKITRRIEVKD